MPSPLPEHPALDGLDTKWSSRWQALDLYRFERDPPRAQVFSIDTPPPTVSGSLHVGHAFSFTHTDVIARYQRMQGKQVFYPMGWDDNGLATERRVQRHCNVSCDPALPYEAHFEPDLSSKRPVAVSRRRFVELCEELTQRDEQAFEDLWRRLGLSVDWSLTYTTIGERARRASQRAFLRLLAAGHAYRAEAPTLWDVDFRTGVAQAEVENRRQPSAMYRVRFSRAETGEPLLIETTRPELLAACVALVAHPSDARYRALIGTKAVTPLFGQTVPIHEHWLAKPDKGTGLAMICTFGDVTDVKWWRELSLETRTIIGRDGRLVPSAPPGVDPAAYAQLAGKSAEQAKKRVLELLTEAGSLEGAPQPLEHEVKFYEKGERPLEVVTSRQWWIRTLPLRERLLERGRELAWQPEFMRARYEAWVNGLTADWLISRQRFFGVPIPVWYRLGAQGEVLEDARILPDEAQLPIDPASTPPPGFDEAQRGQPHGFTGETDVMDTWATSSLTPQIAGGWEDDPALFARVYPMDLRPQAHEIIRTWLFSTIVRSELEHHQLPWKQACISGWVLTPERVKMEKSKGNALAPQALLERYGADALRYWAASAKPGADTLFEEAQVKIGRRLALKVLNASKFILTRCERHPGTAIVEPLDRAMLGELALLIDEATAALDAFDYAKALHHTEAFFWRFCDDHLELVKNRCFAPKSAATGSAHAALWLGLSAQLRLLAPFLPFATEEAWSWWNDGSIHRAPWPTSAALREAGAHSAPVFEHAGRALGAIRKAKSDAGLSLKAPLTRVELAAPADSHSSLTDALSDLREAANAQRVELIDGPFGARIEAPP